MSDSQHRKWLPFDPRETYSRRYVDHFYKMYSAEISGAVLDLGAGSNNYQQWISIADNIDSYLAVDIAEDPTLDIRSDAAHLPFDSGTFDTVILSEVLEHVPVSELSNVTEELYRVLKPGGVVLASTPFIYPEHGPPDHARHTPQSIETLFSTVGFDVAVHRGGGYTEALLQICYRPFQGQLKKFDAASLGWVFAVLHYLLFVVSWLINLLLLTIVGRNPRRKIWYLMTFTIARKEET